MDLISKRIGLLHLAPTLGNVEENRAMIERATRQAASLGAEWILSGELVVSGYRFAPQIGTSWIEPQPDEWLQRYALLANELDVSVFVSHPEQDGDLYYNSLFAIDSTGVMRGRHRKISVIPIAEDWSFPGADASPVIIDGISVGLLICSDAYPPTITQRLVEQGAQVILSSAAWHPGEHGPDGEWEARSRESQLPVIVCNQTGFDSDDSFLNAKSVLVHGGDRVETMVSQTSTVFVVDIAITTTETAMTLVDHQSVPCPRSTSG